METKFSSPVVAKRRKEFYVLMLCLQRIRVKLPLELKMLIFNALRWNREFYNVIEFTSYMDTPLSLEEQREWEEFTKNDPDY